MDPWQSIDAYLSAKGIRIGAPTTGSTTGGNHVAGSLHFKKRGRDYGDAASDCRAVVAALLPLAVWPDSPLEELFYSPTGTFYDSGTAFDPDPTLFQNHKDHVHAGIRAGFDLTDYLEDDVALSKDDLAAIAKLTDENNGKWTYVLADLIASGRKDAKKYFEELKELAEADDT